MFSSNASQVSGSANYVEDVFSTYLYTGNGTSQEISNGINLDGRFISSNIASVRNTESYSTIYAQGKYITCSGNRILTSTDGATWSISSSSPSGGYGNIAFNGTSEYMFVSGGNGYCYTSTDLVNWTSIGTRGVIPTAFSAIGTTYVEFGVLSGTSTKAAYYSSNSGASWTSFSNIFTSYNENPGLLKLVNGILFGCRSGGTNVKLASSTNGTTWTDRSSGISGAYAIYDITYGNGKYVAIDYAGNYYYSTDLSSWTLVSGDGGSNGNIGFFNGYFVSAGIAATYSYKIKTSTDGSTWTEIGGMPSVQSDSSNGMTCADGSAGVMFVTQAARNSLCVDPTQVVKGGLNWIKHRTSGTRWHILTDTARGFSGADGYCLSTNVGNAQFLGGSVVTGFNNSGFSLGPVVEVNQNTYTFSSWTFRKQPKFFDIVTWTGNDTTRQISHSLASVPGCILVKRYDGSGAYSWIVWHRAYNSGNGYGILNATSAFATDNGLWWGNGSTYTAPTSTNFTISGEPAINQSGVNYVAYIFAHDAGGFGLTGTENVISCGYGTAASGVSQINVTLGYEPQWIMMKNATAGGDWYIWDPMRGIGSFDIAQTLFANNTNSENIYGGSSYPMNITSTGFSINTGYLTWGSSSDKFIYVAIRKGPMKVPTDATKVYYGLARSGNSSTTTVTGGGFPLDLLITQVRNTGSAASVGWIDRVRSPSNYLLSNGSFSEGSNSEITTLLNSNGYIVGPDNGMGFINNSSYTYINQMFRRAPSVFDIVGYTGNSVNDRAIPHNLTTAPELVIYKRRNSSADWVVLSSMFTNGGDALFLQSTSAITSNAYGAVPRPTETNFYVRDYGALNNSGDKYIAYLFATCAGVSKVGSYTGTGTTQTINCGFTGGARFVLVKRTDSTGDWRYVDTARGMVSGNDPYLKLNSNSAEINSDNLYTTTGGFQLVSSDTNFNANGGTYIFLAMA